MTRPVASAVERELRDEFSRPTPTLTLFRGEEVDVLADLDDAPRRLGRSSLLWVDLEGASEELIERVAERFGLDDETVASLRGLEGSSTFRAGERFVHVVAHAPGGGDHDLVCVVCVVGETWVVTAHDAPVPVFAEFAALASGSGPVGELDGPAFLASLLEWVLNEYAAAFDRLEEELEEFDERAMQGSEKPEEAIDSIVGLRRRAASLRRSLVAHRATLLALSRPELEPLTDSASAERFTSLLERYESALQTARDTRESVVSSFDVLIARTGHRTNEIMKVLTLASLVFLPGALLAGVMGMNFKVGLFAHSFGFWITLIVMAAIATVPLAVAKARGWI